MIETTFLNGPVGDAETGQDNNLWMAPCLISQPIHIRAICIFQKLNAAPFKPSVAVWNQYGILFPSTFFPLHISSPRLFLHLSVRQSCTVSLTLSLTCVAKILIWRAERQSAPSYTFLTWVCWEQWWENSNYCGTFAGTTHPRTTWYIWCDAIIEWSKHAHIIQNYLFSISFEWQNKATANAWILYYTQCLNTKAHLGEKLWIFGIYINSNVGQYILVSQDNSNTDIELKTRKTVVIIL